MNRRILGLTILLLAVAVWAPVAGAHGTNPPFGFACPSVPPNYCTFADMFQAVHDNPLIGQLGPEWAALLALLLPQNADLNGHSMIDTAVSPNIISLGPNGMNDPYAEMKITEIILKDINFSLPANGSVIPPYPGLTHAQVHDAWDQIYTRIGVDIGTRYFLLLPIVAGGLIQVLQGEMLIGDGDATFTDPKPGSNPVEYRHTEADGSGGFVKALLGLLPPGFTAVQYIDLSLYTGRMPTFFAKDGDADGDGFSNWCEFVVDRLGGGSNTTYVAKAMNPSDRPVSCPIGFRFSGGPSSGFYKEGATLNWAVTTVAATGPTTFQWKKNGVAISGATTSVLTLGPLTQADEASYTVSAFDTVTNVVYPSDLFGNPLSPIFLDVIPAGSTVPVTGYIGLTALLAGLAAAVIAIRRKRLKA